MSDLRPCDNTRSGRALRPSGEARKRRIPFVGPIATIVLIGLAFVGWQRIVHPPIPHDLQPWIEQHHGIDYAPSGAGFHVSLPAVPAESTSHVTVARGVPGVATVALTSIGAYEVGVTWLAVPRAELYVGTDDPLGTAATVAAASASFTLQVQTPTHHGGYPAIDAEIMRDDHDGRALIVLVGSRIYVVFITGPHDLEVGFEHLAGSLKIG